MIEALRKLRVPHSPGAPLFFFTTRDELRATNPLMHEWSDGNGRDVRATCKTTASRGIFHSEIE
jgi:hypothetical protein